MIDRRTTSGPVELSVVVLAWDNLHYTQDFVESVRRNTDVPYELSSSTTARSGKPRTTPAPPPTRAVLNDANLGFAPG